MTQGYFDPNLNHGILYLFPFFSVIPVNENHIKERKWSKVYQQTPSPGPLSPDQVKLKICLGLSLNRVIAFRSRYPPPFLGVPQIKQ